MSSLGRFAEVVRTADLLHRPPQPRGGGDDGAHVAAIVREISYSPLHVLARTAAEALLYADAHSAGITVLVAPEASPALERTTIVGPWATALARTRPDQRSPDGLVVTSGRPQLFCHPHRYFDELSAAEPRAAEMLCVPLWVRSHVRGALWAVLHDEARQFDVEDVRRLRTLAQCAAAAFDVACGAGGAPDFARPAPLTLSMDEDALPGERPLSARERAVVVGVARGFTNRQQAASLGLSIKTVETYRARAADKLGLRDRAQFMAYVIGRGWLAGEASMADRAR